MKRHNLQDNLGDCKLTTFRRSDTEGLNISIRELRDESTLGLSVYISMQKSNMEGILMKRVTVQILPGAVPWKASAFQRSGGTVMIPEPRSLRNS